MNHLHGSHDPDATGVNLEATARLCPIPGCPNLRRDHHLDRVCVNHQVRCACGSTKYLHHCPGAPHMMDALTVDDMARP